MSETPHSLVSQRLPTRLPTTRLLSRLAASFLVNYGNRNEGGQEEEAEAEEDGVEECETEKARVEGSLERNAVWTLSVRDAWMPRSQFGAGCSLTLQLIEVKFGGKALKVKGCVDARNASARMAI